MEIIVEGVKITLTPEQQALVEAGRKQATKEHKQRTPFRKSFVKMLNNFGFKELNGSPGVFKHAKHKWYAELKKKDGGGRKVRIWGAGLPDSPIYPGGWTYYTPFELEKAILAALKEE